MQRVKCPSCSRSAPTVTFAVLRSSGRPDTICIGCRFNIIDGEASSAAGIQDDMISSGVPVRRGHYARKLKFEEPPGFQLDEDVELM